MKRIGILSDTHGYWDDKYLHYFEPCDEIWHAGDIGSVEVAERLAAGGDGDLPVEKARGGGGRDVDEEVQFARLTLGDGEGEQRRGVVRHDDVG